MSVEKVEGLLLDMKDTSELMVDLAYSSVFYGSEGIAHEVEELEETVGEQLTQLQRMVLEAVRDEGFAIDHALILIRLAQTAEVIANSALEIADVVLRDVELHPVLSQAIRDSDSSITKVTVAGASRLCGHTLGDLELETETGMRVLAVKRQGRYDTGIDGSFVVEADDLLIAVGPAESEEEFIATASVSEAPED